MLASIGRIILRYCGKELFTILWHSLLNYYENWRKDNEAKKIAEENAKKYKDSPTPDQRAKDGEDLLNRR